VDSGTCPRSGQAHWTSQRNPGLFDSNPLVRAQECRCFTRSPSYQSESTEEK
jgi:hypothetical protein